mmetsp:Transcript_12844/g.47527  ORF Transcript_12844/g.47527 Transcript_12844/m.47527 type:complete len:241 (-) Transcript_12844:1140-1862(-)
MAAVRLRLTSTITPEGYGPGHCSSSRSKAIVKSGAPASLGSASTGHSPSLTSCLLSSSSQGSELMLDARVKDSMRFMFIFQLFLLLTSKLSSSVVGVSDADESMENSRSSSFFRCLILGGRTPLARRGRVGGGSSTLASSGTSKDLLDTTLRASWPSTTVMASRAPWWFGSTSMALWKALAAFSNSSSLTCATPRWNSTSALDMGFAADALVRQATASRASGEPTFADLARCVPKVALAL